VRAVLTPLAELVSQRKIAVVLITHFNKNARMLEAINRITDSHAFPAVARHVYCVFDDPEDEDQYQFVKAKNNMLKRSVKSGFYYTFNEKKVGRDDGKEIWAPYVEWGDPLGKTADEALAEKEKIAEKSDVAYDLVLRTLGDHPATRKELFKLGEPYGLSVRTIERAISELAKKKTIKKDQRFGAEAVWSLA
jgi:hypothetical protein